MESALSNDNTISAYRPGLKTGVKNYIFWSEIGSGFEEPGGTPPQFTPTKNSQEYPTGPDTRAKIVTVNIHPKKVALSESAKVDQISSLAFPRF